MSVLLNPYVNFKDNTRDAMTFYQSVLGGDLNVMGFGDVPGMEVAPEDNLKVMHAQLETERGFTLMAADTPNYLEFTPFNGSISLSGDEEATLRGYWDKLADGGEIVQPLNQAPWGDTFGMLTDQFGINWLFNIAGAPAS